jgi:hypothetical protein
VGVVFAFAATPRTGRTTMIRIARTDVSGASSHSAPLRVGDGTGPDPTTLGKMTSPKTTGTRPNWVAPHGAPARKPRHKMQSVNQPATSTPVIKSTTLAPLVVIDDHPIVHTGVRHWVAAASIPTDTVPAYSSVSQFLDKYQRHSTTTAVIIYDPENGEQRPDYAGLQQLCELKHNYVSSSIGLSHTPASHPPKSS